MNSADIIKIAWAGLHFGEEPPLVGKKGAGTIFFSGCNLRCVFCQNWQISQQGLGKNYTAEQLSGIMLSLQKEGALNIDLVSPTVWSRRIKKAIILAKEKGMKIPVVWNSNAHEEVQTLRELAGLVDIYLPDFKYGDDDIAFKYSGIKNYVEKAEKAVREMHGQVGNLKISEEGTAVKGLIVRHLIIPGNIENSFRALEYAAKIDKNIFVNLMSQYEPVHRAKEFPEINRNITEKEYQAVFGRLLELGLENGWIQDLESHGHLLPDFTRENPFI